PLSSAPAPQVDPGMPPRGLVHRSRHRPDALRLLDPREEGGRTRRRARRVLRPWLRPRARAPGPGDRGHLDIRGAEQARGVPPARVPEVWIWKGGAIRVFLLRDESSLESTASEALPELDLGTLAR